MHFIDLLKTPIEELKNKKNIDYNIRIQSNDANILFICNDIEKLKFFISNRANVNHISDYDDKNILFYSSDLEKFKLMSSLVDDDLFYQVDSTNVHFISDLKKDNLNYLLTKTRFNLNHVIKNLDKEEYFYIFRSLLMNENKGVPSIINRKLKNKKIPFYSLDNKTGKKRIYINYFRNGKNLKTCFECMPELYNLFDDKNYEDRDFYLKSMDNNSYFSIEEMHSVFYEVKAKKEKAILLKENLLIPDNKENQIEIKIKKRI